MHRVVGALAGGADEKRALYWRLDLN